MPMRHGGRLASRASTWPRDHFCRSTLLHRRSWPTMWNEFLPISMPITAISLLNFSDMAWLLCLRCPLPALLAGGAGARPDHPILGHPQVHETKIGPRGVAPRSNSMELAGVLRAVAVRYLAVTCPRLVLGA